MTKIKDKIIGLKELRENTENYISEVGKGKSFVVMRKSRPVFTISPVDERGDEGTWQTVVDFTDIQPGGVLASDVLKSLKKLANK
jgi:antitoxin (DNA-binding transcriptional repressor) of toxin-antitoxin stability system